MTKQNFISMSLGSGLKAHLSGLYNIDHTADDKVNPITVEVVGINLREVEIHEIGRTITEFYEISDCKPLLRPLSDLTKEIEHGGEKFVPIDRVAEFFIEGTEDVLEQSIAAIEYFIENNFFSRMEYLPFILFQKLIEWHFDIYNLISKNQAIDINALETNPYK